MSPSPPVDQIARLTATVDQLQAEHDRLEQLVTQLALVLFAGCVLLVLVERKAR